MVRGNRAAKKAARAHKAASGDGYARSRRMTMNTINTPQVTTPADPRPPRTVSTSQVWFSVLEVPGRATISLEGYGDGEGAAGYTGYVVTLLVAHRGHLFLYGSPWSMYSSDPNHPLTVALAELAGRTVEWAQMPEEISGEWVSADDGSLLLNDIDPLTVWAPVTDDAERHPLNGLPAPVPRTDFISAASYRYAIVLTDATDGSTSVTVFDRPELWAWLHTVDDFAGASSVRTAIPGTERTVSVTVGSPTNDRALFIAGGHPWVIETAHLDGDSANPAIAALRDRLGGDALYVAMVY